MASDQTQHAVDVHSDQAGKFDAWYGEPSSYASCFAYSRKRLDPLMDEYLQPTDAGLRLLDVGCGTGHQLATWRARGYDITGVDGSAAMLEHARRNNPNAELHEASVERLPVDDALFDRVACIEVLRYLSDPTTCIREMARVTKPGGVCLATAAPLFALNGYAVVNRIAAALPVPGVTRLKQFFTTSRRLRRHFTDAGFTDVRVYGVYLGPLIWIERLAPKALPRVLRSWERFDVRLADRSVIRELSNMYLVRAVRGGGT